MSQKVNAVICGVQVNGMIVMNSKFDGYDPHHKERFRAGAQIAYISKDKLSAEQVKAIFPKGTAYNLAVQWPLKDKGSKLHNPAPVDNSCLVPDFLDEKETPKPKKEFRQDFTPSEYQAAIREVLLNQKEHIFIEALAGSGKTSTLIWLMKELASLGLLDGKNVIYLAFNKSIQEELVEKLQGTGVPAMTTHAFGLNILRRRYMGKINITGSKRAGDLFIKILCDENGYRQSPEAIAAVRKTDEYTLRSAVLDLVSYTKNWGILPVKGGSRYFFDLDQRQQILDLIESYEIEYDTNKFTADQVVDYAISILLQSIPQEGEQLNEVDYDDMLWLPHILCGQWPKYDIVLTDEAQDFNGSQIQMLEKLSL